MVDGTLFNHFVDNMKPVEGYYNAVKNYSIEAAKLYENESLDFVFIDAAHDYENVKADIIAWLPKVKQGGWIGGHDYTWSEGVRQACRELVPGHVPDPSWDLAQNKPNPKYENCSSWMYQIPI